MRSLLTLLLIVGCFTANSAPQKIKLKSLIGTWDAASWDPRLPGNNDTIVIPPLATLFLDKDLSLTNVRLEVEGRLLLGGNNMQLTLDAASQIVVRLGGSILGDKNSQQVRLNGIIFKGNENPILGPVMAVGNGTISGFFPIPSGIAPLPVKYLGVSVARKNAGVLVQWATSQEVSANYYEVERSDDGSNWKAIGKVEASGTTNNTSNYSYTDNNTSSNVLYYRIKQVDVNGRFEYTAVKILKANSSNNTVNATTSRGNIVLQFSKQVQGQVEVRLVSFNGTVVSRQLINRPVGQLVIPATVKGTYILSVSDQQDIQVNKQILL